ncbi:MAG: haloacid dehalogenase [Spirochaetes bacterium GWD1_61_31]|nr:MAG: haloacid dehalogenase [Spirochaetes bacterium GWB1_60_80]OHD34813.1 MAG: haloacid dehalogenase [Spirochaetes bacterium GWC1_61_12]OHD35788.1 MAG: haloacid dehalogenase [Spirochaetes bacterium GWD1_61_31]OHD42925.1 MAG: haloacid dehalogenase [Spirochaetes bacterium GWE1_60_18]OHD61275.1 MAG: haloacid dehalogenase [Spirochaetes bacterium GWF1_60_12]HAP43794.1 HAD family phosphatase [Spirochaetaceae bacterium]
MKPFAALPAASLAGIRFVLFDIDDTITEDGLLLSESFDALWELRAAGLVAIPVTGRPAGWCDLIARQWPVSGVVGENGAFVFYNEHGKLERLYHPCAPEPQANAIRLQAMAARALRRFAGLRIAKDQPYRLFDIALDFAEEPPHLGLDVARAVKAFCEAEGAVAKVSSIHVNSWYGNYDKLSMAEYYLSSRHGYDPKNDESAVLYLGDSPNDEPMFGRFSHSCGVANVRQYADLMLQPPKYVTEKACGHGFAEACQRLLQARKK